jgi:hypothetical protein
MKLPVYVSQLSERQQCLIETEIELHLLDEGLRGDELREGVQAGMDSKVSDIAEIVDVEAALKCDQH